MAERRAVNTIREAPRGIRQPKELKPEYAVLCDRAMERIIDVMEERVPEKKQKGVLTAAAMIREEILGPQKHAISVEGSLEHLLLASMAPESRPNNAAFPEESRTPMLPGDLDQDLLSS